jgi:Tol biopolymer transport system component
MMPRLTSISRCVGLLICVSMLLPASAPGTAPPGPRLAFVEWSAERQDFALISAAVNGGERHTLAGGRFSRQVYEESPFGERPGTAGIRAFPVPVGRISWDPDGSRLAFAGWRIRRRGRHRWSGGGIFVVGADGSGLRLVKTARGLNPIFAPDGTTLAFAVDRSRMPPLGTPISEEGRYERTSVWTVRLDGTHLRQLTPWRNGILSYPSSFSPDGSSLAVTQLDRRHGFGAPAAIAIDLNSGRRALISSNAEEPTYSPDGAQVVFRNVRRVAEAGVLPRFTSDLVVASADGADARLLTDTPGNAEQSPSWDPSGERIAYLEYEGESAGESADAVKQINADGTCDSIVVPALKQTLVGPLAWQPGSGREAGRIFC